MTYLLSLANSEVLSAIIFAEEVLPSYVRRPVPFVPWSKLRSGTDEYASLHGWPVNEGIEIGSPSYEIVDVKKTEAHRGSSRARTNLLRGSSSTTIENPRSMNFWTLSE